MNSNKVQSASLCGGETYRQGMKEVLNVAWPASLTMLNGTIMTFIDGLMVARVGPISLNAQFIAGISCFVTEAFFMGILGVVNTYVAQNYGSKRYKTTSEYVRAGIAISIMAGLLVVPLGIFARYLFSAITDGNPAGADASAAKNAEMYARLISLETMYFRFFMFSLGLRLVNMTMSEFFFGIGRQRVVLLASTASTVANIILNYTLIYGKFGAPAMGLKGAAIGSIIAFGVYFVIIASVYFSNHMRERYGTGSKFSFKWHRVGELLKIGWPSGLQFFSDVFCWFLFTSVIISRFFGQEAVAATVVALRYMNFSFMPTVGLSIATTALVGKYIGMGRRDMVRRRVGQACVMAMIYMGCCATIFVIFREPLIKFFLVSDPDKTATVNPAEVLKIGKALLLCAAFFQLADATAITYCGALRGAGDTRWQMIISIITHWPMVVGGGWLVAKFWPQLSAIGPWAAATVFIFVLAAILRWRFNTGHWEKIDLLGKSAPIDKTHAGDIELM